MLRNIAQSITKPLAAAADVVRPPGRGIVILAYHRVDGGTGIQVDLPRDLFRRQMARLAADSRVCTLDQALDALGTDPPERGPDPVVLTFDDGTADFADVAFPLLHDLGLPATIYVATEFVDQQRPFPGDAPPLSWAALADMAATGLLTVGSHTHRHVLADRTPLHELTADLDRSRELVAEHLGTPAEHFAHPKAVRGTPEAEAAIRSRFRSAALAGTRPNPYGHTDRHALARSPVQVADGMRWFERKVAGGMRLEATARSALNRWRYADATT